MAHLSEREAVFSRTDMLAAPLSWDPGAVSIGEAERTVREFQKSSVLHAANHPVRGESLTTDRAIADEKETISLMSEGQGDRLYNAYENLSPEHPFLRVSAATPLRKLLGAGKQRFVRSPPPVGGRGSDLVGTLL